MPFEFKNLALSGLTLITPKVFPDERGFFMETYKDSDFNKAGINVTFKQDNHSFSSKNVVRGLHYQEDPHAQGKLIRVMSGKIWDVAVDIRPQSATYLKWQAVELSDENNQMLYIPVGFAHGFAVLSDNAHFMYKCSCEYNTEAERAIRWNDPKINIKWPVNNPIVSDRDQKNPLIADVQ